MTLPITYRADIARPLTSLEADSNLRQLAQAIADIEDAGATGVADAPIDDLVYGRRNGGWVTVTVGSGSGGGIAHAPSDGVYYVSRNGAWQPVPAAAVGEAPSDGAVYGRRQSAWVAVVPADPGLDDAPSDGAVYARQSGDWVSIQTSGGGGTAPVDALRYRGVWSNASTVAYLDVFSYQGMLWLALSSAAAPTLIPTLDNPTFWSPVGFPQYYSSNYGTADHIKHRFDQQTGRSDLKRISEIFNTYETRLRALEAHFPA